jgi:hypothetical protein
MKYATRTPQFLGVTLQKVCTPFIYTQSAMKRAHAICPTDISRFPEVQQI